MKRYTSAVLALLLAVLCAGCTGNRNSLPSSLGLPLKDSTAVEHWDDHGGMSDGRGYWKVTLSDQDAAALDARVRSGKGWHTLPVNEDVETLLYGREWQEGIESFSAGPYLTGKDGTPLLPKAKEGYWFFRNDQTRSWETTEVLGRYSFNFTAAIYDSETQTLYCGELDT